MTTRPSNQLPEVHRARDAAESFGVDAARYDRTRPTYPAEMIDRLAAAAPGRDVLDVGCGTGISSRLLQEAGCRVLGLDVDERMAEFARGKGLEVEVAKFEEWEAKGRTFDAVVAAQTWHWVDPVAGAAKAAEVLRPGGLLATVWNVAQPPLDMSKAFAEASIQVLPPQMAEMFKKSGVEKSALEGYQVMFDNAVRGIREAGGYTEPVEWRTAWEHEYTRDEWLDQLPTGGIYTRLPKPKLDQLLEATGRVIDEAGGAFTVQYTTVAVTAVRS
ncbi:class I SAM-dependent methyltransferase [Glycomyces arizonensis]|uniref:class I SAM-dependent methyltransferase n=1 Tax=Glycomyces arizonensis TaxID=256035 RepID=UPI0004002191|nr:class I SAM-dependent methyltransferase [Glycomyces arizonensis]